MVAQNPPHGPGNLTRDPRETSDRNGRRDDGANAPGRAGAAQVVAPRGVTFYGLDDASPGVTIPARPTLPRHLL